jgi:hypothetical protein
MMLDVDFVPCTDFRRRIRESEEVRALLSGGRAALVIPAFEYVQEGDGLDVSSFPTEKEVRSSAFSFGCATCIRRGRSLMAFYAGSGSFQDLLRLVEEGRLDMFHRNWQPGHSSTLLLLPPLRFFPCFPSRSRWLTLDLFLLPSSSPSIPFLLLPSSSRHKLHDLLRLPSLPPLPRHHLPTRLRALRHLPPSRPPTLRRAFRRLRRQQSCVSVRDASERGGVLRDGWRVVDPSVACLCGGDEGA